MTRQLQALNQVSRRTDVLVSEASNASERLHQQSDLLLQAVSRFRLLPDVTYKRLLYSLPVLA